MKKKQVAYEEVARNYDEKSPKIAKLCLLLLLPMGALVTAALFYRSKRVYFDHFILSVETSSFYVFLLYLFVPLIATLLIGVYPRIATVFSDDSWLWIVFAVLILVFQVLAFRRFFKEKWPWTILKAVIYSTLFSVVVKYIYIMIVFYLTMLFV